MLFGIILRINGKLFEVRLSRAFGDTTGRFAVAKEAICFGPTTRFSLTLEPFEVFLCKKRYIW